MNTTDLVDLLRRFVLLDDEAIVWTKDYPAHMSVDVETTDRVFSISPGGGTLRVEDNPGVPVVIVATREDQEIEGRAQHHFLLMTDGAALHLEDPATSAAIGQRVAAGEIDPVEYAEILVHCQWPGGWAKQLILDRAAWRAGFPAEAAIPAVEGLTAGGGRLTFTASRETTESAGGRPVLDVTRWSVTVSLDEPATWDRAVVAAGVPLAPPW